MLVHAVELLIPFSAGTCTFPAVTLILPQTSASDGTSGCLQVEA